MRRYSAVLVVLWMLFGCQSPPAAELRGSSIVATMDSGGYTYVQLETGDGKSWYAVPQCEVAVGDRVVVADGAMAMHDFESSTLKRTFPLIYFATGLERVGDS